LYNQRQKKYKDPGEKCASYMPCYSPISTDQFHKEVVDKMLLFSNRSFWIHEKIGGGKDFSLSTSLRRRIHNR
jgi:hypothetical protein